MKTWLIWIPFTAFATAFVTGAIALWFLGKGTKISQSETRSGKALHVESPLGALDVRPEAKLDPRLAQIPIYPGAMPENAMSSESVSELRIGDRTLQEIPRSIGRPTAGTRCGTFIASTYRIGRGTWPRPRARNSFNRRPIA